MFDQNKILGWFFFHFGKHSHFKNYFSKLFFKINLQLRYLNIKGVNECIFVNYCKGVFSSLNSGEMFLKSRGQLVCFMEVLIRVFNLK